MNTHIPFTTSHQMWHIYFLPLLSFPHIYFFYFSLFPLFLLFLLFLFLNHLRVCCRHDTSILIFQCVSFKNKDVLLHNHNILTTFVKFNIDMILLSNILSIFKFLQLSPKCSLQLEFLKIQFLMKDYILRISLVSFNLEEFLIVFPCSFFSSFITLIFGESRPIVLQLWPLFWVEITEPQNKLEMEWNNNFVVGFKGSSKDYKVVQPLQKAIRQFVLTVLNMLVFLDPVILFLAIYSYQRYRQIQAVKFITVSVRGTGE